MAMKEFEALVEDFEFLDDWEERYRHIIELGRALPPFPEAQRNAASKVDGCVSQVWIVQSAEDSPEGVRVRLIGDSDAHIVRGLIAVLRTLFDGMSAKEAAALDVDAALNRIDLADHISPQRSNGLRAMVSRIKGFAAKQS